jgi:hypothetical protein
MPTTKPRLTITLEPRTHEVLARLSAAGGESMSALITQFVDLAVPSMERLVVILEHAKRAPMEVKEGLAGALERAESETIPRIVAALDQGDMFLEDVMSAVQNVPDRTEAAGASRTGTGGRKRGLTPVLVTRGSGALERAEKGRKGGRRG